MMKNGRQYGVDNHESFGFADGSMVPIESDSDDIELASQMLLDGMDDQTRRIVNVIAYSVAADFFAPVFIMILNSKKRDFTCDLIASVFGFALRSGWSDVDLAKHYGTSKQDILNHKKRIQKELGVKILTRASKKNTAIYAKTNFQQIKKEY